MNILLIYPPSPNRVRGKMYPEVFSRTVSPPLGLMYIAAYLKENTEHNVRILDMNSGRACSALKTVLREFSPGIVGITAITYMLYDIVKLCGIIKSINGNIHINLGGPHTSLYPEETLGYPGVDSITVGDGEAAFSALAAGVSSDGQPGHNI